MSRVVRVAGVQHNRVVGDVKGNLARIESWTREAAAQGAQIVALPELSNTGYICWEVNNAYFELAEEVPGPTTQFFAELARELGIIMVGGLYERDARSHSYYNTAVFVGSDGLIGRYRKTHIASKPTFMEKYYFSPGNLGYPVFDLGFCRAGVTICYDRHFPECYRHMALQGAEIALSITNTGSPHSIGNRQGDFSALSITNTVGCGDVLQCILQRLFCGSSQCLRFGTHQSASWTIGGGEPVRRIHHSPG